MNKLLRNLVAASVASMLPAIASASSEVQSLTENPNNWAIWGGDYAGTRYSELDQINADNVRQSASRVDILNRRTARP